MTVDGRRGVAFCWATFVLLFSVWFPSPWTTTTSAAPVPVRPYRLALLRLHSDTGSGKPEGEYRRTDAVVNANPGSRSRRQSFAKLVPAATEIGKARGATDTVTVPLPVVAFLKAAARQVKPRAASDTRRTTTESRGKARTKRKKSRHKKRGVDDSQVITIHTSGLPLSRALRRSKQTRTKAAAAKEDDYYEKPYSDYDYDKPYQPDANPYPEDPEPSYPEAPYEEDDHADGYSYAEQDNHEYSDATYNQTPYDDTGYQEPYQESSYAEPSDGYQDAAADEYGHADGGEHEQSSYHESETHDYQEGYDSGYSQDYYSDSSYPESGSYHETSDDEYGHQEDYHQPSYPESETNDYHQDQDNGYQSPSYVEGYATGPENEYPSESYPEDSYQESEYDDTQPYQPVHEQPEYHENSYQPDYRPTYPLNDNDDSASYQGYDQASYPESSSYEEAAAYPESSHEKDYNCPSAPGKTGSLCGSCFCLSVGVLMLPGKTFQVLKFVPSNFKAH